MTPRSTWIVAMCCGAWGCVSDDGSAAGVGGGSGAEVDAPSPPSADLAPTIAGASALCILEGRAFSRPLTIRDPEGGPVHVEVEASPDVLAYMDGAALVVTAGYGIGPAMVQVRAVDAGGRVGRAQIPLSTFPLRWKSQSRSFDVAGPAEREGATLVTDEASASIYLMFGVSTVDGTPLGDAWRLDVDARRWSEVALEGDVPPPGSSRRFAGRHGVPDGLLFGGRGTDGEALDTLHRVVANGDRLRFEAIAHESAPGARADHVFAHDPTTGTYVLFGGVSEGLHGDTWTMELVDGSARWTPLDLHGPAPRARASHGFDHDRGRLLLFGGEASEGQVLGDTWVLDLRAANGPTWSPIAADGAPEARRDAVAIWDPTGPRLFLVGGMDGEETFPHRLHALHALPGHESWVQVADDVPRVTPALLGTFLSRGGSVESEIVFASMRDGDSSLALLGY